MRRCEQAPLPVGTIRQLKFLEIVDVVCKHLNVTRDLVGSSSRNRRVVVARSLAYWLCRELTKYSYPELARLSNRENHSSVVTAVQRVERQRAGSALIALTTELPAHITTIRDLAKYLKAELEDLMTMPAPQSGIQAMAQLPRRVSRPAHPVLP